MSECVQDLQVVVTHLKQKAGAGDDRPTLQSLEQVIVLVNTVTDANKGVLQRYLQPALTGLCQWVREQGRLRERYAIACIKQ